jgi:hypothetical protein
MKRLRKFAIRKCLILKDAILVDSSTLEEYGNSKKEKREQAPALHTQLYTGLSIACLKGKSTGKTFPISHGLRD